MAITVTDMRGGTIPDVHVEISGPTMRMGETNGSGQLNFPGLQIGTYRLRFTGDPVTAFEKEVTLRAGQIADVDVTLTAAPPKPVAPPPAVVAPPPPPPAVVGPVGAPQSLSLYDLAERELAAKQPRREILVACSGNLRTMLVFLTTQDQTQRIYETAEVSYYVLGGQANVRVNDKDNLLAAGGYVAVPRNVPFSIVRRGKNPVSLLSILSGEPCDAPK
jgi:mannose-6-phosphate isomerase-like protein (cupin superfamily)